MKSVNLFAIYKIVSAASSCIDCASQGIVSLNRLNDIGGKLNDYGQNRTVPCDHRRIELGQCGNIQV
jgi:hypothetical protein